MTKCLQIKFDAVSKNVRGFIKRGEHEIPIALKLKPPTEDVDLIPFVKDSWIKEELVEHGAGPEGELPEIEIFRITYREVVDK